LDAPGGLSRPLGGPGFDIVERVLHTIRRHGMTSEGQTVVVAVSGGPDSMCLFDVLDRLDDTLQISLEVAHVDHGLRESSDEIASTVAKIAAERGHDAHVMRIKELSGGNVQAKARELRYRFFEKIARDTDAAAVATGHTLDDRAETTLARLIHGAGTEGLAGLEVAGRRIRPLSSLRRSETRAYCEKVGLFFEEDPANLDERYERVSARRVLASIEERWGDGAVRAMARSAERLREDADALREQASLLYEGAVTKEEGEESVDLKSLLRLPRALRRRILELMIGRVRDRAAGIEAALDALERERTRELSFDVASGIELVVSADRLRVIKSGEDGGE
jgi:tRNA(Ile)-lysidine synthase